MVVFKLKVKPLLYYSGKINTSRIINSNKVIVPLNVLKELSENFENMTFPIILKIKHPEQFEDIHVGIEDFGPNNGTIYIPERILQNEWISHDIEITVTNCSPPKGSFIKLKPHKTKFIELDNPKKILETNFINKYPVVRKGETICVTHNKEKFYIDILDCKPSNVILSSDVDLEVDFEEPFDYVEPKSYSDFESKFDSEFGEKKQDSKHKSKKSNFATIFSDMSDLDKTKNSNTGASSFTQFLRKRFDGFSQQNKDSDESEDEKEVFIPFSGTGHKLG